MTTLHIGTMPLVKTDDQIRAERRAQASRPRGTVLDGVLRGVTTGLLLVGVAAVAFGPARIALVFLELRSLVR